MIAIDCVIKLVWFGGLILANVAKGQEEGSKCELNLTGAEGICRRIENCPGTVAAVQNGQQPKVCTFDGSVPIVCCQKPMTEIVMRTTTTPRPELLSISGRGMAFSIFLLCDSFVKSQISNLIIAYFKNRFILQLV